MNDYWMNYICTVPNYVPSVFVTSAKESNFHLKHLFALQNFIIPNLQSQVCFPLHGKQAWNRKKLLRSVKRACPCISCMQFSGGIEPSTHFVIWETFIFMLFHTYCRLDLKFVFRMLQTQCFLRQCKFPWKKLIWLVWLYTF